MARFTKVLEADTRRAFDEGNEFLRSLHNVFRKELIHGFKAERTSSRICTRRPSPTVSLLRGSYTRASQGEASSIATRPAALSPRRILYLGAYSIRLSTSWICRNVWWGPLRISRR